MRSGAADSPTVDRVITQVRHIAAVGADDRAGRSELDAALADVRRVQAWTASVEARLASRLAEQSSFAESDLAGTSRGSVHDAGRTLDRSKTLQETPALAAALEAGTITAGHVDALTRSSKNLEPDQRRELFERVDQLDDVATAATVAEFARRVRDEARRVQLDDGMARLERQQRASRASSWIDGEGMWNLRARVDPLTGVRLDARLGDAVEVLFAEATPDTAPSDPVEKQAHLRALAFARLLDGDTGGVDSAGGDLSARSAPAGASVPRRPGRPEFVVVVDADAPEHPGPIGQWSIPVEIPARVLADLVGTADVHAVVVRNGIVLHAPGELNLGRTTRLANRAQRRALRALYSCCAIPGCSVAYDRCKLHHVIWWRHGVRTDLDNLLPVCTRHHSRIHHDHWTIQLGANRELTVTFPDGTVRTTGPPSRRTTAA